MAEGRKAGGNMVRDLAVRTKRFALRIVRLYAALPLTSEAQVLGKELLRSGTSVGAHYRQAAGARSAAGFIEKVGVGLQELEETIYWLELLVESGLMAESSLSDLMAEAGELIAVFEGCIKTAEQRIRQPEIG